MLDLQGDIAQPTPDKPLLVGMLVDVSGSMLTSMQNASGRSKARLQGLRDALDDLVEEGKRLCWDESNRDIVPLFRLFAYGFGFGNPIYALLGRGGPAVRDLLETRAGNSATLSIDKLAENWDVYKAHIAALAREMLGKTPMREGLSTVANRFARERTLRSLTEPPVLFFLSDGEPTDGSYGEIVTAAESLKQSGVLIISCFVTDEDVTAPRTIYGSHQPDWKEPTRLMFDCASPVPPQSSFMSYLTEYQWIVEPNGRLFTQINESELMSEFARAVLSPLRNQGRQLRDSPRLRVFVSYSHEDREYLAKDSLLGYLKGLEREGFDFWVDTRITAGDEWDDEIRTHIKQADIALLFVSQAFLNSSYCQNVEVAAFFEEQRKRGLQIVPIILRACDWHHQGWFDQLQSLPRDGKNIESDFRDRGRQAELYLDILQQLRAIGNTIRAE